MRLFFFLFEILWWTNVSISIVDLKTEDAEKASILWFGELGRSHSSKVLISRIYVQKPVVGAAVVQLLMEQKSNEVTSSWAMISINNFSAIWQIKNPAAWRTTKWSQNVPRSLKRCSFFFFQIPKNVIKQESAFPIDKELLLFRGTLNSDEHSGGPCGK